LLTTPILHIRRDLGKPRLERWRLLARGENELLKAEGEFPDVFVNVANYIRGL